MKTLSRKELSKLGGGSLPTMPGCVVCICINTPGFWQGCYDSWDDVFADQEVECGQYFAAECYEPW